MGLVDEALAVWEATRNGVISEIDLVSEDQLDYRPDAQARSIRDIGRHVVEHGIAFTNELLAPECNFGNLFKPAVMDAVRAALPRVRTKADLLALLRETGEGVRGRIRERGDKLITDTQPSRLVPSGAMSRLSGLWFAIAHESHHRGQLTAYLRAAGVVPALTRQLMAQQNR
jgi:uncharacterized damage-inducible protein DinB